MAEEKELTITEKVELYEEQGWRYQHDGLDWSSGVWYHDNFGSVNNGGGSFRWIGDAITALERFLHNLEMCQI